MNEEDTWFLKARALDMLLQLGSIEELPVENSIRNAKTIAFIITKKDAKHFIEIISAF